MARLSQGGTFPPHSHPGTPIRPRRLEISPDEHSDTIRPVFQHVIPQEAAQVISHDFDGKTVSAIRHVAQLEGRKAALFSRWNAPAKSMVHHRIWGSQHTIPQQAGTIAPLAVLVVHREPLIYGTYGIPGAARNKSGCKTCRGEFMPGGKLPQVQMTEGIIHTPRERAYPIAQPVEKRARPPQTQHGSNCGYIRSTLGTLYHARDSVLFQYNIRIKHQHIFSGGQTRSSVHGSGQRRGRAHGKTLYRRVRICQPVQHAILRAVVHHNDFQRGTGLCLQRGQAPFQPLSTVVRHDDRRHAIGAGLRRRNRGRRSNPAISVQ